MRQYLDLVEKILTEGKQKNDRTGTGTIVIPSVMIQHDMAQGFPLLTTKKIFTRAIKVELEGFIKGITDKKWYQDKKCNIWNEWCNPEKVSYGHDEETRLKMKFERDLGPIYGFQWRHWNASYDNYDSDYEGKGIDQLANIVDKLKTNPTDRRMIINAWNPEQIHQMALPPCHYSLQVNVIDERLNLTWNQRSVDTMLGLPFNIASYGLLLHLLAKETGLKEGILTGNLMDTHIYGNHLEGAKEQLKREPKKLPEILTKNFNSIFDWQYVNTKVKNYDPHDKITFPIAV